jgi:inosine-uridine nucleoside N-ribohydrolase
MKRVIIDTDPGIDDTAAILLALASPELTVEAVTTVYGNGTAEHCTRNALIILETAGRGDIPVYRGVGQPLLRDLRVADYVHGSDALGGVEMSPPQGRPQPKHAARELVDRVMASPGEITLIALGPLTNVALALSMEPEMAGALAELILMGGAVLTHGNASEVATANLYNDPEATAIVYQSGAPLVQAGLDVCLKTHIKREQLARIEQANIPTTNLLAQITPQLAGFYASRGLLQPGKVVGYNDLPAIAYAIDPGLFEIQEYYVRISTHDELTRGQTVADVTNMRGQPPNAKVLMDVDATRMTELFTGRVIDYVPPESVRGGVT